MPASTGLAQPDLGGRRDLPVIQGVAAFPRARRGDEILPRGADVVRVAHQVCDIADAAGDMHG